MKHLFIYILMGMWLLFPVSNTPAGTIKIAGIFAETGIAADNNRPHIQILKIGIKEINSHGGLLGRTLELIIIDNKSTPIGSKLAAEKAVSLDVTAVIGAAWSSHSLQVAPVLQRAKIPMITGSSTNPKVTLIGDYIFRTCFVDSFQARAMAQFACRDLKAKNAVVLEIINEDFSLTLAELFVKSFLAYGGRIIAKESYQNNAVNFSELLKRIRPLKPDVVYTPGYGRDCGLLIKQAASVGLKTTFLGADGWGGQLIYTFGGKFLEGSYQTAHWHTDVNRPKSIELQKKYKAEYGQPIPHMNAPLFYDALMVLADAIQRAGTLDHRGVRDILAETDEFEGATGNISFDENGDPINKPVVILKLGRSAPMYFKTIQQ